MIPPASCVLTAVIRIPNHCGQDNMYQNAYRCQVIGATASAKAIASPVPAVWCENDPGNCIVGPKQLTIQYQAQGNNVKLPPGFQKDGSWPSPGYNLKMGFKPGSYSLLCHLPLADLISGAQTDIFSNATAAVTPNTCPDQATVTVTKTVTATVGASTAKSTKRSLFSRRDIFFGPQK